MLMIHINASLHRNKLHGSWVVLMKLNIFSVGHLDVQKFLEDLIPCIFLYLCSYVFINLIFQLTFLLSTSPLYRTISFLPFNSKFTYARDWVPDWLRRSRVKVFVLLCSDSTCRCVRSSKQIGAETFVKNNGERIIE